VIDKSRECVTPPSVEELSTLFVLDSLKGFGPQKFKQLHEARIPFQALLKDPAILPVRGKRAEPIREQIRALSASQVEVCRTRAEKQLLIAEKTGSQIVTYRHPDYPKHVFESNNPIPVLYVRGNADVLKTNLTVACVGSRQIREPYIRFHRAFARTACSEHFAIVSGFALGADTVGHKAAVESGGKTICVMPSGLDRPFPPENKDLWLRFLGTPTAVFVSEFGFGTGAASLNLRKRNKLITAFSLGVLLSQSSATGGAMNAFRFALEQKKPVATFGDDFTDDTSGNRQIAATADARSTVFSAETEDRDRWVAWLRKLSSST
jgi:DNA processing protein